MRRQQQQVQQQRPAQRMSFLGSTSGHKGQLQPQRRLPPFLHLRCRGCVMGKRECLNKNFENFYSASTPTPPVSGSSMTRVDQAPALLSGCGIRTHHHLARPRVSPPCQHHPPGLISVEWEQRYDLSPTASCVPHQLSVAQSLLSRQSPSLQLCSCIQLCLLEWLRLCIPLST